MHVLYGKLGRCPDKQKNRAPFTDIDKFVTASGSLNSDKYLWALLQLRNTPDPDCNVSPAQIIFGRPLKDAFSFINRLEKFSNDAVSPIWREAWQLKEQALRARFMKTSERLNIHVRNLKQLKEGDRCFVQNQTGPNPNRWDRTGIIVEARPHDQYIVKIDGSGRLTTRNRKFLRHFQPATMEIQAAPTMNPQTIENNTPTPIQNPSIIPKQIGNDIASEHPTNSDHDTVPLTNVDLEETETLDNGNNKDEGNKQVEKVPMALKRLFSHNKEGLKENPTVPDNEGRRLRSRKPNNAP